MVAATHRRPATSRPPLLAGGHRATEDFAGDRKTGGGRQRGMMAPRCEGSGAAWGFRVPTLDRELFQPRSRKDSVENGERTRLACSVPRPRGTQESLHATHRLLPVVAPSPTGASAALGESKPGPSINPQRALTPQPQKRAAKERKVRRDAMDKKGGQSLARRRGRMLRTARTGVTCPTSAG